MDDICPPHMVKRNVARLYQLAAGLFCPTPRATPGSPLAPEREAHVRGVIASLRADGAPCAVVRAQELEIALDQIATA